MTTTSLVFEVSGEAKKKKQATVAAADLWVPAVNAWGHLGRWAFLEVSHMEHATDLIPARGSAQQGRRSPEHATPGWIEFDWMINVRSRQGN